MIEHRGINYDVGSELYIRWRPDYDQRLVRRELEIIKNDLHCNAVGISGKDIGHLIAAAEVALGLGLEAWLSPMLWNKSPEVTLAYRVEAAKAARPLHERYPGKVVFGVGHEETLFMRGIVPGRMLTTRIRHAFNTDFITSGQHVKPLNDWLAEAVTGVREVFDGPLLYRSLSFEQVDWSILDYIGVDHYWSEEIQDRYLDMVKPLFEYGKPVINTGFGFNTTSAPVARFSSTFGNINNRTMFMHQLPGIGRFIKPKLNVINERDESKQAERLVGQLELLDTSGFKGAFIDTFVFPANPYSDTPRYDLDRESSSLVRYYDDGRHGTTYPDMTWEPKKSFKAVAGYYAGAGTSPD